MHHQVRQLIMGYSTLWSQGSQDDGDILIISISFLLVKDSPNKLPYFYFFLCNPPNHLDQKNNSSVHDLPVEFSQFCTTATFNYWLLRKLGRALALYPSSFCSLTKKSKAFGDLEKMQSFIKIRVQSCIPKAIWNLFFMFINFIINFFQYICLSK